MKKNKGFTLIELLIVIAIFFIICAFIFPMFRRAREESHQLVCLNHLKLIGQASLMYCQENDGYFPGLSGVEPQYGGPLSSEWIYWESSFNAPFNNPLKSPIIRYLSNDLNVLHCPSDDSQSHTMISHKMYGTYQFSYVINSWTCSWPSMYSKNGYSPLIPAYRIHEVHNPSQKIFFLEEDPRYIDDGSFVILLIPQFNWSEMASYVHDTNRVDLDPNQKVAGIMSNQLDHQRRTNIVFCDGHAEFITQSFLEDRNHYDPFK